MSTFAFTWSAKQPWDCFGWSSRGKECKPALALILAQIPCEYWERSRWTTLSSIPNSVGRRSGFSSLTGLRVGKKNLLFFLTHRCICSVLLSSVSLSIVDREDMPWYTKFSDTSDFGNVWYVVAIRFNQIKLSWKLLRKPSSVWNHFSRATYPTVPSLVSLHRVPQMEVFCWL